MRAPRHAIAGLFGGLLLLGQAGADEIDRRILPVAPTYTRNATCASVSATIPFEIHTGTQDVGISPSPKDLPLNQGESAICFAYATADMISHRVGRPVSPLDVATKFYFGRPS